jgi:tRNA(fMet)-specific endonuclease VapC
MWLPDTNVWIRLLNRNPSPVKTQFARLAVADIFLCEIVKAELYFGAFNSAKPEANLALIDDLSQHFPSIGFDEQCARQFGQIRARLKQLGTPIGPYDMQIAAIALRYEMVLVTHNTREFARVEGVQLEDWEDWEA